MASATSAAGAVRMALASLALFAAAAPAGAHDPANQTAHARALLDAQISAWNRGDLEAALNTYCPSAATSWVSSSGISHGFDGFAKSMRTQFGGGPARMGKLAIDLVDTRQFGDGSLLMVVRWSITSNGSRIMGGISSQLWADCGGQMRVAFEHAS